MQHSRTIAVLLVVGFCLSQCTKQQSSSVKIQIDYLGSGGYYNDNIDAVPTGLTLGINGPYPADPDKTYTLEYKADENFPVLTKTWSPATGPWKIHCYVQGNYAYMNAEPGN